MIPSRRYQRQWYRKKDYMYNTACDLYNINVICIEVFDRVNHSTLNRILYSLSTADVHHDFFKIVLQLLFPCEIKR